MSAIKRYQEKERAFDKLDKKPLLDKKNEAVELWRQTRGHISDICRAIGISRQTFYDWVNKDKEFANALVDAESELHDDVRDALIQKIADGDTASIMFYLKKRHPDFKDQMGINVATQINIELPSWAKED